MTSTLSLHDVVRDAVGGLGIAVLLVGLYLFTFAVWVAIASYCNRE